MEILLTAVITLAEWQTIMFIIIALVQDKNDDLIDIIETFIPCIVVIPILFIYNQTYIVEKILFLTTI